MATTAIANPLAHRFDTNSTQDFESSCRLSALAIHQFSPKVIQNTYASSSKQFEAKKSPLPQLRYAMQHHPESRELIENILNESKTTDLNKATATLPDIFLLLIYLMQLSITSRQMEFETECQEKMEQLKEMEEVVKNYTNQGSWSARIGLVSGIGAVASGLLPLVGHLGGSTICARLSQISPSLFSGVDPKIFTSLGAMAEATSKISDSSGKTYELHANASRHFHEVMERLHQEESSQSGATMREKSEELTSWERILKELLQAEHEVIRQLYS